MLGTVEFSGRRPTQRAILDAAAKLLSQRGYTDVTIEGIAAEAKVGKTTIYRWWPTKASIFIDVYSELSARVVPPPETADLTNDLRLLVKGAFKLYRSTAAGLALAGVVAEAQSNPEVSRIVRAEFVPSRRLLSRRILERAVVRGEVPGSINLDVASELITGAVWYYVLVGTGPTSDSAADQLVELIVRGVAPQSPRTSIPASSGIGNENKSRAKGQSKVRSSKRPVS